MTPGAEELPTEMGALADRCEQATEPDRELFEAAYAAIHGRSWAVAFYAHGSLGQLTDYGKQWAAGRFGELVQCEAWLDAAMTLVPEGFHHGYATGASLKAGIVEAHCFEPVVDAPFFKGGGASPALALCAAALRARSQANPATSDSKKEGR